MNQWLTVVILCCAASLIFSIFALWHALRATKTAAEQHRLPRQKLAENENRLTAVEVQAEEISAALTVLANKVKMMRVRSAAAHTDPQEPNASDPGRKDWLRRKAGLVAGQPAKHS